MKPLVADSNRTKLVISCRKWSLSCRDTATRSSPLVTVRQRLAGVFGGERRNDDGSADVPDHPVVTAVIWHGAHYLDFGYLRNPPKLRFWRTTRDDRGEIAMDWRHEDDGEIGFTTEPTVQLTVPTTAYLEAVHTLNRQLIDTMGQRVDELERRGGLPGVDLDLVYLRREHDDRRHWLAKNLDRSPKTDWNAVRQGSRLLLSDVQQADAPTG
ncbi:DUF5984 family protein [Micromonospora zamorensis]|uniref:DUF5984 family protein n=1 Tax=Micromonospora zamorensis TaxID=709883 RepID=UPI0033FB67A0